MSQSNIAKSSDSVVDSSSLSLIYRQLTEADGVAYYEVLHEGYASNVAYGVDFSANRMTKEEALAWVITHPTYGLFVDGQLASSITLRMPWGPKPGPSKYPHIGHFVTSPRFKQQGYAKKLLHWLETVILYETLKSPFVTLGTADNHPWLKDMYLHLGFTITHKVQLPGLSHKTIYFEKKIVK